MLKKDIDKLAKFVAQKYELYAPVRKDKELLVKQVKAIKDIDYSAVIPDNSFKQLFLPSREELFYFEQRKIKPQINIKVQAKTAWGMTVLDLKALGLFDLVFVKDPYYQLRRDKNLVIGISAGAPADYAAYKLFSMDKEENVLEHVPFDIFLERNKANEFRVYAGSGKGRKVLRGAGIDIYENIQFVGLIREEGLDERMVKIQRLVKNSDEKDVWNEIAKKCIACGKCSIVCPTCFCFDLLEEKVSKDKVEKVRQWGNCFYPEFSQIAGQPRFLQTVKQRLFFWYEHKFCRIPAEYKVPGCVSCMRCFKVCPVGINIAQVLTELEDKSE